MLKNRTQKLATEKMPTLLCYRSQPVLLVALDMTWCAISSLIIDHYMMSQENKPMKVHRMVSLLLLRATRDMKTLFAAEQENLSIWEIVKQAINFSLSLGRRLKMDPWPALWFNLCQKPCTSLWQICKYWPFAFLQPSLSLSESHCWVEFKTIAGTDHISLII